MPADIEYNGKNEGYAMGEFYLSDVREGGGSSLLSLLRERFPKVKAKELQDPDRRTSGRVLTRREERVRVVAHALWMAEGVLQRQRDGLQVRAYKMQKSLYFFVVQHNMVTHKEMEVIDDTFYVYHLRRTYRYREPRRQKKIRPTKATRRWLEMLRYELDKD
ncbi:hypothetical protein A3B35_02090 [Candidatus Kaiserbacteria bacterium RIFCSPLOWO2_01_FULL_54_24]|uniref:Uncharacterized protein n=1 Tax=Candidatus Kaiserbacteria bacterium RIFCSPLOWO2_01_FULL_54_24 TaxID=1798515 RepID=A0A1F6ETA2_9BACT|nr:MAG: hypothetical protein A3B35_02090 [Candidatus Kaiserbacteria bacterium RIFCSPLOWO2_01_FULL_54_24]